MVSGRPTVREAFRAILDIQVRLSKIEGFCAEINHDALRAVTETAKVVIRDAYRDGCVEFDRARLSYEDCSNALAGALKRQDAFIDEVRRDLAENANSAEFRKWITKQVGEIRFEIARVEKHRSTIECDLSDRIAALEDSPLRRAWRWICRAARRITFIP
jgi:hypothetical protein